MEKVVKSASKDQDSKCVNSTKNAQSQSKEKDRQKMIREVINLLGDNIPGVKLHTLDDEGNLIEMKPDKELS